MAESIKYGIYLDLAGSVEELRPQVEAALKAEGFGVLTEINVRATIKAKLDEDVPAQLILGACNPAIAHAAMQNEPDLGLLLPCNVTLRDLGDGRTRVATIDARQMLGFTGNASLEAQADEAASRLERVLAVLGG